MDLRLPPLPVRHTVADLELADQAIRTWRFAPAAGQLGLDMHTVLEVAPGLVRAVVTDPAHNRADSRPDDVLAASALVCTALEAPGCLHDAVRWAEQLLHRRFAPLPIRRLDGRPSVCVAAAELDRDGRLTAVRAGDCEVWAWRRGSWVPVLVGDWLTAAGRACYATSIPSSTRDRAGHLAAHDLLRAPGMADTTPLGFTDHATVQTAALDDVDGFVVVTDGLEADGDPGPLARLDDALRALATRPVPSGHPFPHGDLACVRSVRVR